jgi:hypothetical protein
VVENVTDSSIQEGAHHAARLAPITGESDVPAEHHRVVDAASYAP